MSFYFVFAGHGDVADGRGFVELSDGPFTSDDLDVLLARVGARESHVILDSCNSFFVISPRKPGGRRFATPSDAAESLARRHPGVGVFLSTSAEAQVYEWSELQSGIFSHAVRSGLAGAADADGDSRVSYQELAAFVDIAAAGIRNPGYRPKVFARGPAGDGNRTLVDLNARNLAVLAIDDPGAVRLRVRDTDGLRWVDLYKEEGASIELRLPHPLAQRMEVERLRLIGKEASVEARYRAPLLPASRVTLASLTSVEAPPAGRGANELSRGLFAHPFGPRAMAELGGGQPLGSPMVIRPSDAAPEAVFGIAQEDGARMNLLLSQLADAQRQDRLIKRSVGIAVGVGYSAVLAGLTLTSDYPDVRMRNVFLGVDLFCGATVAGMSLLLTLRPSEGERIYRSFLKGMALVGTDEARVVANTEQALFKMQERERSQRLLRIIGGGALVLVGAGGAALEYALLESDHSATTDMRVLLVGGTLFVAVNGAWMLIQGIFATSPSNRLIQLWQQDPSLSKLPRLSVGPTPGGGAMFALSGQW